MDMHTEKAASPEWENFLRTVNRLVGEEVELQKRVAASQFWKQPGERPRMMTHGEVRDQIPKALQEVAVVGRGPNGGTKARMEMQVRHYFLWRRRWAFSHMVYEEIRALLEVPMPKEELATLLTTLATRHAALSRGVMPKLSEETAVAQEGGKGLLTVMPPLHADTAELAGGEVQHFRVGDVPGEVPAEDVPGGNLGAGIKPDGTPAAIGINGAAEEGNGGGLKS